MQLGLPGPCCCVHPQEWEVKCVKRPDAGRAGHPLVFCGKLANQRTKTGSACASVASLKRERV